MQDETKQLVLADDHHLLRRGFRSLLSNEPGLEVVGEASTGLEAIEICRRLAPDLVLMDVRMPEMDGITATRQIKREQPGVSVLMVTMHENPDYLLEALDAGAAGYVLKDAPRRAPDQRGPQNPGRRVSTQPGTGHATPQAIGRRETTQPISCSVKAP
jgi:DNA-binding NarL/FixJ family response regulator